jgi:hypothetical protein
VGSSARGLLVLRHVVLPGLYSSTWRCRREARRTENPGASSTGAVHIR